MKIDGPPMRPSLDVMLSVVVSFFVACCHYGE